MRISWRLPWARKDIGEPQRGATSRLVLPGMPIPPTSTIAEGMQAEPVSWAGMDALAFALSRPSAVVMRGDQAVDDHPLALRLNERANSIEDARRFRYRHALQFLTSTRGVFTLIGPDMDSLTLLDPSRVTPVIEAGELKGYAVETGAASKLELGPDEVVWHCRPHPYDLVRSLTPAAAAGIVTDAAREAALFLRRWVANDGGIRTVLMLDPEFAPPTDEEVSYLRSRLQPSSTVGAEAKTGTVEVLVGKADVKNIGGDGREIRYSDIREALTDDILLALRTPRSIAGDASGRTFANAAAEQSIWWEWTVEPLLALLASGWSALLPDGERLVWQTADIPAVQRSAEDRIPQLAQAVMIGLLTTDEARARLGLAETPTASASLSAKRWSARGVDPQRLAKVKQAAYRRVTRAAKPMRDGIRSVLDRHQTQVLEFLETRGPAAFGTKALSLNELIEALRSDLGDEVSDILRDLLTAFAADLARRVGVPGFEIPNVRAEELVRARTLQLVDPAVGRGVPLPDRLMRDIRAAVADGMRSGEGLEEMSSRIRAVYDAYRDWQANRIALTETHWALNTGELEAALGSGVVETKTWLAVGDDRTRETHADADGQRVAVDEPFVVGGYETMTPGDTGDPGEDINCRCQVIWETETANIEDLLSGIEEGVD